MLLSSCSVLLPALVLASSGAFAPEACGDGRGVANDECRSAQAFVERQKGKPCLVAFKAARLLYLFEGGKPVARDVDLKDYDPLVPSPVKTAVRFPVRMALGPNPVGHKQRHLDAKTPEGEYQICGSTAKSSYTHFLAISYPAPRDVEMAVREKRFPEARLERVRRSQRPRGQCPDYFSALGGAVGIHGAPTHMASDLAAAEARDPNLANVTSADWTLGCLAVENRHVRFLAKEVKVGTPIMILP